MSTFPTNAAQRISHVSLLLRVAAGEKLVATYLGIFNLYSVLNLNQDDVACNQYSGNKSGKFGSFPS
jgi:hypothetical protein